MTTTSFLVMLSGFSLLSSFITEGIKRKLLKKTVDVRSYNILATVVALVVGAAGTLVYYQLTGLPFTVNNFIYAALMGLASGLASMIGYDKVKQAIEQIHK